MENQTNTETNQNEAKEKNNGNAYLKWILIIASVLILTLPFHYVPSRGKVFPKNSLTFSYTIITEDDIDRIIERQKNASVDEGRAISNEPAFRKLIEEGLILEEVPKKSVSTSSPIKTMIKGIVPSERMGPAKIRYKIIVDKAGETAKENDMVIFQRTMKTDDGTIIVDSFGGHYKESSIQDPPSNDASFSSVLGLLSEGDSAIIKIPNEAAFDHEKEFPGDSLHYIIKIYKIISSHGRSFEAMSKIYKQAEEELEQENKQMKIGYKL